MGMKQVWTAETIIPTGGMRKETVFTSSSQNKGKELINMLPAYCQSQLMLRLRLKELAIKLFLQPEREKCLIGSLTPG